MLAVGNGFYIQILGESTQRVFHPAKLVGQTGNVCIAVLEEAGLGIEEGLDILIYYNMRSNFVKQAARVDAVIQIEPEPVISFVTVSEPVSAEGREDYRVSTVMADLTVILGDEDACPLQDVSAVGFSAIPGRRYRIGEILDASFVYDGEYYTGKVCVLSIRESDKGRRRYGVHCIDDKKSGGNLLKGLQSMSMAIQRQQLRRLAATT